MFLKTYFTLKFSIVGYFDIKCSWNPSFPISHLVCFIVSIQSKLFNFLAQVSHSDLSRSWLEFYSFYYEDYININNRMFRYISVSISKANLTLLSTEYRFPPCYREVVCVCVVCEMWNSSPPQLKTHFGVSDSEYFIPALKCLSNSLKWKKKIENFKKRLKIKISIFLFESQKSQKWPPFSQISIFQALFFCKQKKTSNKQPKIRILFFLLNLKNHKNGSHSVKYQYFKL